MGIARGRRGGRLRGVGGKAADGATGCRGRSCGKATGFTIAVALAGFFAHGRHRLSGRRIVMRHLRVVCRMTGIGSGCCGIDCRRLVRPGDTTRTGEQRARRDQGQNHAQQPHQGCTGPVALGTGRHGRLHRDGTPSTQHACSYSAYPSRCRHASVGPEEPACVTPSKPLTP